MRRGPPTHSQMQPISRHSLLCSPGPTVMSPVGVCLDSGTLLSIFYKCLMFNKQYQIPNKPACAGKVIYDRCRRTAELTICLQKIRKRSFPYNYLLSNGTNNKKEETAVNMPSSSCLRSNGNIVPKFPYFPDL